MKRALLLLLIPLFLTAKTDVYTHTDVGKVALTVTNFGMFGNGLRLVDPSTGEPLPSMEYPIGSRTEHLYRAGLWIGGISYEGETLVTTGVSDAPPSNNPGTEGFEFFPTEEYGDTVIEKSTLLTSSYYDPDAVSEQDFYATYYDYLKEVPHHTPLHLEVKQTTYCWSYSYTDDFVIVNFVVTNKGDGDITDLYFGIYAELATGNRDFWGDDFASTPYYQHKRLYFLDSLAMIYEKNDGFDTLAPYLAGVKFLGLEGVPPGSLSVNFHWWTWKDMVGSVDDKVRYGLMSDTMRHPDVDDYYVATHGYPDPISLLSVGPVSRLHPGDSLSFTFAFVCGEDFDNLMVNASWAQKAYEMGYILPSPPPSPNLYVVPGSREVTLYFDDIPLDAVDPSTHCRDFEGFRIYRTENPVPSDSDWVLLAQFDLTGSDTLPGDTCYLDHSIGFNTGLPEKEDTGAYAGYFKFVDRGVRNGFTYYYAVTSYDVGDPSQGLESLESAKRLNTISVIPGTPPTSEDTVEIGVYPNPYRLRSLWDTGGERGRVIRFYNLPKRCRIYIFNLAGDLVKTIEHEDPYSGEESWNLITDRDQPIATGLYITVVKDLETGKVKKTKFAVIK